METFAAIYPIKEGAHALIEEWAATLNARKDEVIETLRAEGVHYEIAFLDTTGADERLIYILKCDSVQNAFAVFDRSTRAIDTYHRTVLSKALGSRILLQPLIDFEATYEARDRS